MQLSLVAAWGKVGRLGSADAVQDRLQQAFMAETIIAGGVAITRVVPEILRAGIAFTGRPDDIEQIDRVLSPGSADADAIAVAHSQQLGGPWPH